MWAVTNVGVYFLSRYHNVSTLLTRNPKLRTYTLNINIFDLYKQGSKPRHFKLDSPGLRKPVLFIVYKATTLGRNENSTVRIEIGI